MLKKDRLDRLLLPVPGPCRAGVLALLARADAAGWRHLVVDGCPRGLPRLFMVRGWSPTSCCSVAFTDGGRVATVRVPEGGPP